jgi:hypothetical protein
MLDRYSLIGLLFALFILLLDLYLLRKRKIEGRGFVLWFIIGAVLGLFSGVPALFSLLTILFGTEELISAVTVSGFFFFLLAFFYLYYRISELHSQVTKLAMELSVAKYGQKQGGANPQKFSKKEDKSRQK